MTNHYRYVLYCADGTLYCGYTTDVARRLAQHQAGHGAKYTRVKARRPLRLLYATSFPSKRAALQAEYQFKQLTRRQKEAYLAARGIALPDKSSGALAPSHHFRYNDERC